MPCSTPTIQEESPAQAVQARRLELILAGVLPQSENNRFNTELAARAEELIAACMSGKGFQYTAKNPRSLVDTTTSTDFSSLTYAQSNGFGISSWPIFEPSHENDAYEASLVGERMQKYNSALSSCADSSGVRAAKEFGVKKGNSDYTRIDGMILSDPRYQSAGSTWAECAKSGGFSYPSRISLIAGLRKEHQALMKRISSQVISGKEVSQSELEVRAKSDAGYQEFNRKEIAAAVATFPCSQAADKVYQDLFKEFIGPEALAEAGVPIVEPHSNATSG
ncbi:hypothetical protein ACFVZ3_14315 [Kitasatospora purpeofusca]|uniref:hypothetical protein n=1 Tax=Kitasatospora purpeofusca TaxID=67352 RepID=UPI00369F93FF